MSTDLRDPASKPPGDGPTPEEKPKPALSLTQVVGGALAAMTAAFLGSRLSVAGTVVGAALASVVAAVAGAVYTSSLRRTSQTVSTVWRTVVRPDGRGGTETVTEEVTEDGTVVAVDADGSSTAALAAGASEPTRGSAGAPQQPARRRIGWKPVAATAVLIFAIAAVALTGFELATGSALSGGSGTTVGRVAEDRTDPAPKPTATRSSSAEPSESASSEPTAAPTSSDEATPSREPTADPTAEPTPTVGAEPTPSATAAPSSSAAAEPTAEPSAAGGSTP